MNDAWKIADPAISRSSSALSLFRRILGVLNRSGTVDDGQLSNCYFEMIIYVASVMLKSIAIEYINYFEMVIRCLDDPYDPSTEKQSLAMQVQSSSFNGGGRGKSQFPNKGRGRAGFNGGRGRGGLGDGDDTRVCTHCGKNNHIVQNCFVKYGYPPGFQHKNNKAYVNHAANFASEQT
ncbi:hypothetical protein L195_g038064, partial [Trifolium pratense]